VHAEAGDARHVVKLPGRRRGGLLVLGVDGRLGQVGQHEDAHGQGVHADQPGRHIGECLRALGGLSRMPGQDRFPVARIEEEVRPVAAAQPLAGPAEQSLRLPQIARLGGREAPTGQAERSSPSAAHHPGRELASGGDRRGKVARHPVHERLQLDQDSVPEGRIHRSGPLEQRSGLLAAAL